MRLINLAVAALVLVQLLSACATPTTKRVQLDDALVEKEAKQQREIALETQIKYQARLLNVSFPILEASAPFCEENILPVMGCIYLNKYNYDEEFREAATDLGRARDAVFSRAKVDQISLRTDEEYVEPLVRFFQERQRRQKWRY